jgi:hypothetical protein
VNRPTYYTVGDPFLPEAIRADFRDPPEVDQLILLMRGESPSVDLELFEESGQKLYDFVWTTYSFFCLVSARLTLLMSEAKLSGWTSHPASTRDSKMSGYERLVVHGRCGALSYGRAIKKFPTGDAEVTRGISFEPSSWDGSDLFMPEDNSAWLFLTDRAVQALLRAKPTNVDFVAIEDVEF